MRSAEGVPTPIRTPAVSISSLNDVAEGEPGERREKAIDDEHGNKKTLPSYLPFPSEHQPFERCSAHSVARRMKLKRGMDAPPSVS
jgi:hypothetical protein